MLIVTLILGIVALMLGLQARRGNRALQRRTKDFQGALSDSVVRHQEAIARHDRRLRELTAELKRVALKSQAGMLACRPGTALSECLEMDAGMRDHLSDYAPAGAMDAAIDPAGTLDDFSRTHGIDLDKLLLDINLYLQDPSAYRAAKEQRGALVKLDPLTHGLKQA